MNKVAALVIGALAVCSFAGSSTATTLPGSAAQAWPESKAICLSRGWNSVHNVGGTVNGVDCSGTVIGVIPISGNNGGVNSLQVTTSAGLTVACRIVVNDLKGNLIAQGAKGAGINSLNANAWSSPTLPLPTGLTSLPLNAVMQVECDLPAGNFALQGIKFDGG